MERHEITARVDSYLTQSLAGQTMEVAKFDFKARWYDLNSSKGTNEFIKDTSSMANSYGPDGIIVIGFDDEEKTFCNTNFKDSGLNDPSKAIGLINKKVDRIFSIDIFDHKYNEYSVSIIHIPPSLDKPHVVTNYKTFNKDGSLKKEEEQKIFVRKGPSTLPASKNDIELMFYDRKNIVPDYQVFCSFHTAGFNFLLHKSGIDIITLTFQIKMIFENTGRRPVAITDIQLDLSIYTDPSDHDWYILTSSTGLQQNPVVINPGNMIVEPVFFTTGNLVKKFDAETLEGNLQFLKNNIAAVPLKKLVLTNSNSVRINSPLEITL